jgi:hypothetical protein
MSLPEPNPDESKSFGLHDGAMCLFVLALGAAGYLCDAHSPLVQPLLPLFGLFFAGAGAALLGICVLQAARHQGSGWLAGVTFGLFPVVAIVMLTLGAFLFGLFARTGSAG